MTDKESNFNKLRARKLASLAEKIQNKSPGLSRYYMFKARKITQNSSDHLSNSWKSKWCMYCGSLFSPDNIKVRLDPKIPLTSNLRKLLKKYFTNPHSLGKFQGRRIARYLDTKNKLTITCRVCNKKRKIEGSERRPSLQSSKAQSTPGSESLSMSKSLSKMVNIRLKKKKRKQTPTIKDSSFSDSLLLTSTPSPGNLSMSSTNSKWEKDSTPLTSKYQKITPGSQKITPGSQWTTPGSQWTTPGTQRTTPGTQRTTPGSQWTTPGSQTNTPSSQRKQSKKVNHLKRLLDAQKPESEDSLMNFLQSVS